MAGQKKTQRKTRKRGNFWKSYDPEWATNALKCTELQMQDLDALAKALRIMLNQFDISKGGIERRLKFIEKVLAIEHPI